MEIHKQGITFVLLLLIFTSCSRKQSLQWIPFSWEGDSISGIYIEKAYLSDVNTETGVVTINLRSPDTLYNEVLNEIIGVKIGSRADMINLFQEL